MTARYRWLVMPPAPSEFLTALSDLPPISVQLLYNRGIRDRGRTLAFLDRSPRTWSDPLLLPEMEYAVHRVMEAIHRQEEVVVFGDFDADGITGTALLVQVLQRLGARATPYIPHRDSEGYGLSIPALKAIRSRGAGLVISVDCGTSSVEEIAHARVLGLDVIVADHHAIPPRLPQAVAIVNPHRVESRYPFDGFSGVGVAYKLSQAVYHALGKDTGEMEDCLDLVAIGTVADIAPLREENRWMVQRGLDAMNRNRRVGLRALRLRAGLGKETIDASHLGFAIAPRINAMGRLEHAMSSYRLLTTQDHEEALALAEQMEVTNQARQRLTQEVLGRAQLALAEDVPSGHLVMVEGADYAAGVIGLVAGRLAEDWYRPAVVVERGLEFSRGSARSIPEFSIVDALAECSDLLVRYGGHPQAAGFTVETSQLPALRERLGAVATNRLKDHALQPTLFIDAETSLGALPGETMAALRQLEPFGAENPEPLFLTRGLPLVQARTMGSTESHLELKLAESGAVWRAVGFGMGQRLSEVGDRIDVVYTVGIDHWQGQDVVQLRLRDFCPTNAS